VVRDSHAAQPPSSNSPNHVTASANHNFAFKLRRLNLLSRTCAYF